VLQLVEIMRRKSRRIVSVDVPSGVNASTGEVMGTAVTADVTVCPGLRKLGTAITPGLHHAGTVHVVDIGIDVPGDADMAELVTSASVRVRLPARGPDSHKGTFGRVGIAVGPMQGAAVLAGWGAARSGAGLVVLGHRESPPWQAPPDFVLRAAAESAADVFADCQSIVIGPGIGQLAEFWRPALAGHRGVLDADGLPLAVAALPAGQGSWVLTPHPRECARLLGWSTEQVQAQRLRAALALAEQTQTVVVLKGYHSVIARFDGAVRVNPTGDASLATAGTGDVLAGVIGSLLAQGLDPFDAAACGAWLHGRAGELAGQQTTAVSTMASDVVDNISRAIHLLFDTAPGDGQLM
jgi:NAD(P)H-hydrate epimerase